MALLRPGLSPQKLQTFEIAEPLPTHWRPATCAEVECEAQVRGWRTTCDLGTDLGVRQARYIRDKAGRHFTHEFSGDGKMITFTFPAGQQCFTPHRVSLGRPALFVVRRGGHRDSAGRHGGPRPRPVTAWPGARVFDRPDQWADDLHEATDRVAAARQRG